MWCFLWLLFLLDSHGKSRKHSKKRKKEKHHKKVTLCIVAHMFFTKVINKSLNENIQIILVENKEREAS